MAVIICAYASTIISDTNCLVATDNGYDRGDYGDGGGGDGGGDYGGDGGGDF